MDEERHDGLIERLKDVAGRDHGDGAHPSAERSDKSWVETEHDWLTRTTDEPEDELSGPDPAG